VEKNCEISALFAGTPNKHDPPMSDISLNWGPLDWAEIALFVGAPGLVWGALLGAIAWRRHRLWGALLGAITGLVLWDAGVVIWRMGLWS
jgi:hypothetical protein